MATIFLYASLQDVSVAPKYISSFVTQLVELIVKEVAFEKKLCIPPKQEGFIQEVGWLLHGSISHLAIRRQIYQDKRVTEINQVIEAQVKIFVAGLPAIFEPNL
jgi:hypothetical protein